MVKKVKERDGFPFSGVLPEEYIRKENKGVQYRDRVFTPERTVHAFLSQVMGEDQSCQNAVTQVIAHLAERESAQSLSANTSAYCQARSRLPEALLPSLSRKVAVDLEVQAEAEWKWRGRSIKLTDGTTVSMPDTLLDQAAYPQPATQKKV